MKLKKGDIVKVIAGKDKGKTGKIIKAFPSQNKVLVEGINQYKKHVRPKRVGEKGEIILISRPLDVSKVMLVCSSCGQATRVGYLIKDNEKTRYCKKCKATV
ncbi:MAG: 50S ribosomal protein L24 [Candidatus Parcubacteria bacterium]|nr:MAG: 50S ribosomal protein L24 [Candidatus Parcubacteria bacterium]